VIILSQLPKSGTKLDPIYSHICRNLTQLLETLCYYFWETANFFVWEQLVKFRQLPTNNHNKQKLQAIFLNLCGQVFPDGLDEDGLPSKAHEIQGHRHILSFSDGQRACLGKAFALAEVKAVLSVFVRYFVFELENVDMEVERAGPVSSRLRVVGKEGTGVPLRVRWADQ